MEDYSWPKITADTSLDEVREIHKRIWDYVIEYGEKPITPYIHNCVLCEYAGCVRYKERMVKCHSKCFYCPARWTTDWCASFDDGLYLNWGNEKRHGDLVKAKEYAKQIRDIPFKEDIIND